MKRAALHSLGCKVNSYETEAMSQILKEAGYEIVPFSEEADVYVINTCTVTNTADKKSRQMIHRAKKRNPNAIVVACGCYVQVSGEEAGLDPAIDIIIGNNRKNELVSLIAQFEREQLSARPHAEGEESKKKAAGVHPVKSGFPDENQASWGYEEMKVDHPSEHTRAFLKVQDGCNQFCSYCIIPYARGRVRSRTLADVTAETRTLAANGFREVVLTGIHLSSWGMDLPAIEEEGGIGSAPVCGRVPAGKQCGSEPAEEILPRQRCSGKGAENSKPDGKRRPALPDLIRAVHAVEGIERIRLGSLEPRIITREFLEELIRLPKVCPHFHLSLQSGSASVLRRMNRRYTPEEYREKCRMIREYYEHPALTTDIIVGFPGETEEEFAATKAFARSIEFYEIHVFRYSRRNGTPAAVMPDQIPESVKAKRSGELMQIAADMKQEFESWYTGREVSVLFEQSEEQGGKQRWEGFTPEYVRVSYFSEEDLSNQIRTITI